MPRAEDEFWSPGVGRRQSQPKARAGRGDQTTNKQRVDKVATLFDLTSK